jgi:hypothetical protein
MRSFEACTVHQILLGDQVKGDKRAGNAARIGEMRNEYTILVWKPEGKRRVDLRVDGKIILELILGN